jgi:uncharacterized tellurite resistance protein B-like protein
MGSVSSKLHKDSENLWSLFLASFKIIQSIASRRTSNMSDNAKQLLKILIGAAWLDGQVQPEEQQRLHQIAQQKGLLDDPQLHPWLNGQRSVSAEECHLWIDEYLGPNPALEKVQELLEEISGLIYSDSDVDDSEAQLLMELQQKEDAASSDSNLHSTIARSIQNLYYRWGGQ